MNKIKFPCLLTPISDDLDAVVMFTSENVGVVLTTRCGHFRVGDIKNYNLADFRVVKDLDITLSNDYYDGVWRI